MKNLVGRLANGAVLLTVLQVTSLTHAAPQVIVTDPKTGQPLAKQPNLASSVASSTSPMQNPKQPTLPANC